MDKVKKKRHPIKNLPIKWSFMLYVVICIIISLLLSVISYNVFDALQSGIYYYYKDLYEDDIGRVGDIMVGDEIVSYGGIIYYTEDLHNYFSERDSFLYDMYGILAVVLVPCWFVVCIFITATLFYRRKLKKPLLILDKASERISEGDLDFTLSYNNRNEMGRLVASFETMRSSLEQLNREMWQMMEQRKRLNAAFAHDLRTPLTVLKGYSDFLLKYYPEDKVDKEKLISTMEMMGVQIKRLESYTQSMSSLQKLEELQISPESVGFKDLCNQLKSIGNVLIGDKTLEFDYKGEGSFLIDAAVVSQVFENLTANAVRYASSTVKVEIKVKNALFLIQISDDGKGFSEDALKKATEPYFRDEKDLSDVSHFGIGLYICRLLCEKHGGELLLRNIENGAQVMASFKMEKLEE